MEISSNDRGEFELDWARCNQLDGFAVYLLKFCLSTLVHCLLSTSTTISAAVAVAVADVEKNLGFVHLNQAQTHLDHLKVLDELWGRNFI